MHIKHIGDYNRLLGQFIGTLEGIVLHEGIPASVRELIWAKLHELKTVNPK